MKQMDPLCVPIMTILRPTQMTKLTTQEVRARAKNCPPIDFVIKDTVFSEINKAGNFGNNKSLKIQVRCLRLDGIGFEHMWPKFGSIKINSGNATEWKIPPPPNDTKKRKDEMTDITTTVKRGKN